MKKILGELKQLKWYNLIASFVAGIINATGVALFLIPGRIIDGGFSGTSYILSQVTNLPLSLFIVIINIPFFIFGIKKQGINFLIYSIFAIGMYSLTTYLYQSVFKISDYIYTHIKEDLLLCSLFGGLLSGVGSGLAIRSGGAMDGIDTLATVFSKKIGITVGQFEMIYNAIQYIIACIVFGDIRIGLYSIISYSIGLKAVDFVIEGLSRAKACFIVTTKSEEMADAISQEMRRGITLISSTGYYSKNKLNMLYCVVNRFEIGKLKKIVAEIDCRAFVTINDVGEVVGNMKKNSYPSEAEVTKIFSEVDFSEIAADYQEIEEENTNPDMGQGQTENIKDCVSKDGVTEENND